MAINLSGLAPITTAATALSNLVLVSPQATVGYQPQSSQAFGPPVQNPPAFLFHYEGEQSVDIESDITDHFIEDNTAIQDQISLKPEIVTTQGFIGELNDVPPKALELLKLAADKLTVIGAYTPALTVTAQIAYSEAFFLYQVGVNAANAAIAAWSSLTGSGGTSQNRQQQAFQLFYGYWSQRTLFTVQTPWTVFQNMAIKTLRPVQDESTRVISSFHLTFKRIRLASSVVVGGGLAPQTSGQLTSQAASVTDLGTSSPVASTPLADGLTNMGVA